MNLLHLVLKQMRQRALSTWLTLLTIILGVALAIAVLILYREAGTLFGQSDYGYELIVGPKGSSLQLVVNTVYHMDQSPGNIPWEVYDQLRGDEFARFVKAAVPFVVGDTCKGYRVVGTLPALFGVVESPGQFVMEYRPGQRYGFASGKAFAANRFEAVLGSEMARETNTRIGDSIKVTHDAPAGRTVGGHQHEEAWKVVGILKPTHTAADRVVHVPLASLVALGEHSRSMEEQDRIRRGENIYARPATQPTIAPLNIPVPRLPAPWPLSAAVPATLPASTQAITHAATRPADQDDHDHHPATTLAATLASDNDHGHHHHGEDEPYSLNRDGSFNVTLPQSKWMISGVLVKSRSDFAVSALMFQINNGPLAMAVNPAGVMREFFNTFLRVATLMLLTIACLVTIVADVGILVSIYNAVSARLKEIAILRALGATRLRVLSMICLEATLIGLAGGVLGLLTGHLATAVISGVISARTGQGIAWYRVDWNEILYLVAVTATAAIAGLVPALKAYRTPVATNLVSA